MNSKIVNASGSSSEPHHEFALKIKTQACKKCFRDCLDIPGLYDDDWLEQKSAEFNWWNSGLKADKSGPGSLDTRLKLRPDVKDVVADVLDGLEAALCKYNELATSDPQILEEEFPDISRADEQIFVSDEQRRSRSPWSDMSDSSGNHSSTAVSDEGDGDKANNNASSGHNLYREQRVYIETNLEILIRIHTAIKRSGLRFRNQRADDDLRRSDEDYQLQKVVLGEHQALKGRTGEHEMVRRFLAKFVLGNDYNEQLMQRMSYNIDMLATKEYKFWEKNHSELLLQKKLLVVFRAYFYDPARLTMVQRRLINANVVRRNRFIYASSATKASSRTDEEQMLSLQGKPTTKSAVQRPLLPDEYTNREKWRGHVAQDICAYLCVFEDCESPDDMFASTFEWMSHMAKFHSEMVWLCTKCAKNSARDASILPFDEPAQLKEHILTSHQVDNSELDLLVEAGKRTVRIQKVRCPLCRAGPLILKASEKDEEDKNTSSSIQLACLSKEVGLKQLEEDDHIATHIHEFALYSLANLVSTWQQQGHYEEAEQLEIKILVLREEILGEKHTDTIQAIANLASIWWWQGCYEKAEQLEIEVLILRKEILGEKHLDTIHAMTNLVSTWQQQGRYEKAEQLGIEVLILRKEILGERHLDTILTMANLASIWQQQGRYEEAERFEIEVLTLRKEILGEKHPDTILAMANLASTWWQQGHYKKAERFEIEVLILRKEILGEKHPDTIHAIANLASTWQQQGRYEEAEQLAIEVLILRKEILGERHPDTILTMANLASIWQQQGRYEEAEQLAIEVLTLRKEILGEKHLDTILTMANLASTWQQQGRYEEAERFEIEVLTLRKEILGEKHPDTILAMANLASTWWQQGYYNKAKQFAIEVFSLRKEILGEKHPDTILAMANLVSTWWQQGYYKKAEQLGIEVLILRKEILGEKHPDTILTMANLASIWQQQGRYKEAEQLAIEVLTLRKEILGEKHPDTIYTMTNLASTWWQQGQYKKAEQLEIEVLILQKEILGEKHL